MSLLEVGTWFANPAVQKDLLPAFIETMVMLGITGGFTVALGLPLGVLLYITSPGAMAAHRVFNAVLSTVINLTRSIPFAILMLALIPLARLLVGTALGPVASSVSLTIAAIPFFARLVETALRDVSSGKLDAAHAMGSTRFQSITKVLLPEALPALVASVTTTLVTIVGYSAMAGLIGGGGLGRLGYNYGYQRFQPDVMIITVVILVLIVQVIQMAGDRIATLVDHR